MLGSSLIALAVMDESIITFCLTLKDTAFHQVFVFHCLLSMVLETLNIFFVPLNIPSYAFFEVNFRLPAEFVPGVVQAG